jgi:hypothetical protein
MEAFCKTIKELRRLPTHFYGESAGFITPRVSLATHELTANEIIVVEIQIVTALAGAPLREDEPCSQWPIKPSSPRRRHRCQTFQERKLLARINT